MSPCESPHLHVYPIPEECLDGELGHSECNRHRSMCEGDSGPCVTCNRSYENSVYHFGKDPAAAMGPVEQHRYKDYRDVDTT